MDGRNKRTTVAFSSTFWIALVFGLCVAPNVQAQYNYYNAGITYDVTATNSYSIWIDGEGTVVNFNATIPGGIYMCWFSSGPTLNFGAGAYTGHIDAGPGSTVNLNGGSVGFAVFVASGAEVTVAGAKFVVDGAPYDPGTKLSVQNALVTAYDTWDKKLFSGSIWCDMGTTITLGAEAGDLEVQIDVKPGSDPTIINLRSGGVVPVAVLSDGAFDATSVSPETVQFAGASVALSGSGKYMAHVEDVDEDGDDDMLLHFRTEDLKLADGIVEAIVELTGQLASPAAGPSVRSLQSADPIADGTPISGTEKVYIRRPKTK
jgi:hypothetical protein